ncbi:hypothetical protein EVAR_57778_1 [Eumeta japonica]|uniref:Uncharacterized protein n=1 Tax=Eumeta variegata TaxID=151549 RepID=A0A4C1Y681_EUMVA|nr:hypothetical protein EVAR_57778_1 [Eumeta japonica]
MLHLSDCAHGAIYLHTQISHPGLPFHFLSSESQFEWHGTLAAFFVTFMATCHLSSQFGNRSRTLWSLATARSARRDDTIRRPGSENLYSI